MRGIADECLVAGANDTKHDIALLTLLHAARLNGIKFNEKKMQFRSTEYEFFGHVLTPDGMKVDLKKVAAVSKMDPLTNKHELQSFLGLVNYMKKYSCKLTKLGSAFRKLQKEYSLC